jgi:glycosyltransferase involved in cell wall biosynthesis
MAKDGPVREKQFSWDKCADDTLKFYRELVGG